MTRTYTLASLGLAAGVIAGGIAAGVSIASADEVVTTTTKTTTYAGTVSEIRPSDSTIILRSDAASSPVTYTYTNETTFEDMNGQRVSYETIRNAPVRVEYVQDGPRTIVRRVVQTGPATVVAPVPIAPAVPAMPGRIIEEKTTRERHDDDD